MNQLPNESITEWQPLYTGSVKDCVCKFSSSHLYTCAAIVRPESFVIEQAELLKLKVSERMANY